MAQKIEYNEDGQPLAESFIAHAKARCVAADEVVKNSNKISDYDYRRLRFLRSGKTT